MAIRQRDPTDTHGRSDVRDERIPQRTGDAREDRTPDSPTDLSGHHWKDVFKRTLREFKEDNLTDWAAALTYYGIMALFPALLVLVSLLGLIGASATQPLIDNLSTVAPGPAKEILTNAIRNIQSAGGAAGFAFVIGLAGALWSASGYVGAFMRASNAIYEAEEGRPFWKLRPLQIAVTLGLVLLTATMAILVVISGPLARKIGDVIGLGDTAVTVYNIAKWPLIALVVSQMIAALYYLAPNVRQPGYRWVSPGGIVAVVLWVVASAAFAFYVANFGNYNKTYGSLGGVIIFLVWLWISNIVILLGAELNAEVERGRQIEGGMRPADKEPFLPLRDPPKDKSGGGMLSKLFKRRRKD